MQKANKWLILVIVFIFLFQSFSMPTFIIAESKELKLQMYNKDRKDISNTISPNYQIYNTGNTPINLKDIKIRYYYMTGGDTKQNFWCDWCSAGTSNIKGTIVYNSNPKKGADTYVEISFSELAGILEAGSRNHDKNSERWMERSCAVG